ncbi:unnamed protein product [Penicillium viridicatum]
MEHAPVQAYGSLASHWGAADTTQVLELIPADDPFQPRAQWNVIADASHALFPEQGKTVLGAVLPWLNQQSSHI